MKSRTAFRTTGEVAADLKRGGGRRHYRPEDVDPPRRIRQYLYQEGYTIREVQKLLGKGVLLGEAPPRDARRRPRFLPPEQVARPTEIAASQSPSRKQLQTALEEVRRELLEIRALLGELLAR